MKMAAFTVQPVFLLLVFLLAQSSSIPILMGRSSSKAEAMRLNQVQEPTWTMRKKMLVALDNFDGCGCYSHDDCKNTPACGSYCEKGAVIGACRQFGRVQES